MEGKGIGRCGGQAVDRAMWGSNAHLRTKLVVESPPHVISNVAAFSHSGSRLLCLIWPPAKGGNRINWGTTREVTASAGE